jgi:hypothetical protein
LIRDFFISGSEWEKTRLELPRMVMVPGVPSEACAQGIRSAVAETGKHKTFLQGTLKSVLSFETDAN